MNTARKFIMTHVRHSDSCTIYAGDHMVVNRCENVFTCA